MRHQWEQAFKNQISRKFQLDDQGYVKYPADIEDILDIIEDAVIEHTKPDEAYIRANIRYKNGHYLVSKEVANIVRAPLTTKQEGER